ncbi:MAG: caspase family protein [Spirochaetaceae bacterium]|nr:MAG: caspase family protein [Spirochaetaceae bacterium]
MISIRVRAICLAAFMVAVAGCSPPARPVVGGYAIVYGVSDYGAPAVGTIRINSLPFPRSDAIAIAALLGDQGYDVTLRMDSDATTENLFADIEAVAAEMEQEGRTDAPFFFYFAGHGIGAGTDHLYPAALVDALDTASPSGARSAFLFFHPNSGSHPADWSQIIADQGVSETRLRDALFAAPIVSARSLIVIDACHAGGFIEAGTSHDALPADYTGSGRGVSAADALSAFGLSVDAWSTGASGSEQPAASAIVIASSGAYEWAWEDSRLGHGIFTYFFLEAPRYADRNHDGWITVTEAYNHAAARVDAYWNELVSGSNRYMPRMSGGATDFVLFERR